eukprot:sb/3471761/
MYCFRSLRSSTVLSGERKTLPNLSLPFSKDFFDSLADEDCFPKRSAEFTFGASSFFKLTKKRLDLSFKLITINIFFLQNRSNALHLLLCRCLNSGDFSLSLFEQLPLDLQYSLLCILSSFSYYLIIVVSYPVCANCSPTGKVCSMRRRHALSTRSRSTGLFSAHTTHKQSPWEDPATV